VINSSAELGSATPLGCQVDFPSVTCVLGAMFALTALLLAALLTALLGLAPTPQSLLRAGAGTAGATSGAIVHPARGIR
jgi:hypothetical protein